MMMPPIVLQQFNIIILEILFIAFFIYEIRIDRK